jgi:putative membrane-bound dehydrogenase-like protein
MSPLLRMLLLALSIILVVSRAPAADDPKPIKALFLGDNGHHKPADRAAMLIPAMKDVGIEITYTDQLTSLTPENLRRYDCLIIYANHTSMSAEQETALVEFVEQGGGFVPLHCASACFAKSAKYVALVGGRFKRHGTGIFKPIVVKPDHPIVQGFHEFEVWDESYEHSDLTNDRIVLMERVEGERREPWTWVRQQGKGRVFYTASGHDERAWRNPGFLNLVERGIRWSVGDDPGVAGTPEDPFAFEVRPMTPPRKDVKPFEYVPAKVAFYPPGGQRKGDGAWNQMQLPLSPQESMKHIRVPQGFHVELFASEPEIGKPICMNWDERGRLWLAETVDYPNELQEEGQGRDRIRICEDTDGDGRADKFTVFAEKLSIPTSLTFSRGGVIVHQAPHTLYLKDTNGDDVADERRVLFTGWSTGDTHAGPSNLVYGFDNWIYGTVGYAGFEGTVGGEKLAFKQGFYRFQPDGSKLEFLRSTNNNMWGIGFSEEGILFGSTANHNPSVYMPIANRYYEAVRGWSSTQLGTIADSYLFHAPTDKIRQVDHHGGYTAAAGHALYTARNYPKEYWNRTAFVAEPTGHLVGTFVLARDGADFKSTNPCNLFESDDEWTAPIMAEVGPDGNVWVIDWYNYIVQHNPTPVGFETGKGKAYETELRDKKHGRIYRVVYDDGPAYKPMSLHNAPPAKLVETLQNSNLFWRRHAQRLLVERGEKDVVPALAALVQKRDTDDIGMNVGAIHALRTLDGLGTDSNSLVPTAAAHPSAGVRHTATAVFSAFWGKLSSNPMDRLLDDPDDQVRLAAFLALADVQRENSQFSAMIGRPRKSEFGTAIASRLTDSKNLNDRWIPDAMTGAGAAFDLEFMETLLKSEAVPIPDKALTILSVVAEHYARGKPANTIPQLFATLAEAEPKATEAVISGLAKGWPKNVRADLGPNAETIMGQVLAKLPLGAKGQLVNLTAKMGSTALEVHAREIVSALEATMADAKLADADRIAAARNLMQFRAADEAAAMKLLSSITPRTSPELAAGLIDALAASEANNVGPAVLARIAELTPAARSSAVRLLLSRTAWTEALLAGLDSGKVVFADLSLDQKQALAAHPDKKLAERAKEIMKRGGALPNADRAKVLAELMPLTKQTGDVSAGKVVFTKQCAKCHTHSGQGNKVGPDLTGMAVHPKAELLTHIIDPSRSVEGNFRAYTVVTDDGLVMTGLLASETKTAIELFDAEGKKHTVQRDVIEQLVASNKSVMPEGFEKQVPPQELVDLLEFLTAKGKFFPLPLNKVATVVTTKSMFHEGANGPDRLIFDDWSPKVFAGVPFVLIDPRGESLPNAILLHGPSGTLPPSMPKSVKIPCNAKARAIHLLSGVSGWGYPIGRKGDVSMIVRLHYDDGKTEDLSLKNGEEFADYIRRVDVPGSQFAFALRSQQLRYLSVFPQRDALIRDVEFVKGPDRSAPIVMAATVETQEAR